MKVVRDDAPPHRLSGHQKEVMRLLELQCLEGRGREDKNQCSNAPRVLHEHLARFCSRSCYCCKDNFYTSPFKGNTLLPCSKEFNVEPFVFVVVKEPSIIQNLKDTVF